MNLRKRLQHVAELSRKDRGMGKTMMIARAAEQTKGIVIARSFDEAKVIEKTYKVTAKSMEVNMNGLIGPFFVDHHAMETLLEAAANKIVVLEKVIKELREALDYREGTDIQLHHVANADKLEKGSES